MRFVSDQEPEVAVPTSHTTRRRFSASERAILYVLSQGRCSRCETPLHRSFHADHVVPFAAGGPTDVRNGQALCPTCNARKGAGA